MSFVVKYEKPPSEPAPEGLHQAVCVDVVDLGTQETAWGPKHVGLISWQLDLEHERTGKRLLVHKRYTLSLNPKARLRQDLEAWRGKKFTDEELAGFDLEKLIGVNCQLQIVHNLAENGNTYGNVQAIVPLGRGMIPIRPEGYTRQKDRESGGRMDSFSAQEAAFRDSEESREDAPF